MFNNYKVNKTVVNDIKINYRVEGVVRQYYYYGYPQTHIMWRKVAESCKKFTVVCSDLRGYGDSDKPASDKKSSSLFKI